MAWYALDNHIFHIFSELNYESINQTSKSNVAADANLTSNKED